MKLRTLIIVGIVAALAGASCSGSSDSEAERLVAKASDAMSSRSFSAATSCPFCDPPMMLEYAPPDSIKLSNSPGHDAWKFNLIVGDRWYVSSSGERWLDEVAIEHIGMVLGDPRVLLAYARDPAIQDRESLGGAEHHVVATRVDASRLVEEILREPVGSQSAEDDEGLAAWEEFIDALRLRLWINEETYAVSQLELDFPSFPQEPGEESDDPPPGMFVLDFDAPVDVPADPISLPREEADRLNDLVKERVGAIRGAVIAYNEEMGSYPPIATEDVLGEFLSAGWPENPILNQPVRQSLTYSPGDFCYEPGADGEPYRFGTYGWDSSLGQTIPGCVPAD